MSYTMNRVIQNVDFETVDERTRKALADQGFGVLTEIDVKATMKKKLDKDMPAYRILGACNPPFAYRSLNAEAAIGTMLPCNVVVQEKNADSIEVDIINPLAAMQAVDNDEMKAIAGEIHSKLEKAINSLAV